MIVKRAAAEYTPISIEEMDIFLKRCFRAMKPKSGWFHGEIFYDLLLNDQATVGVRVWTSIRKDSGAGAGLGADAIRVQLFNFRRNTPLMRKADQLPIVKRTRGWRDNLRDRIENYMEIYEENSEYYDQT